MKNTKKFAAMIAALTLSACSIAPMFSFAAGDDAGGENPAPPVATTADGKTTFKLTLPTDVQGTIENVKAYKIFNISKDNTGITIKDDDTGVCENAQNAVLNTLGNGTTIKNAGEKLSAVANGTSTVTANALAKAVASAITTNDTSIDATAYSNGIATFAENALKDGYYIVLCDVVGDDSNGEAEGNDNKAVSLGMLTVVDGEAVNIGANGEAKVGLPSVMKKVLEDDNGATNAANFNGTNEAAIDSKNKWNDGADWAIGQTQSFRLYGSLPDNYDDYDTYYYEFHDTLASQFDDPTNFVVEADGQTLTEDTDYTVSSVTTANGKKTFSVVFNNLKAINKTGSEDALITKDSVITVTYDTALNSTAIVGSTGQENEVYLEYSNNPNKSGSGDNDNEHGETPKDKVIVFTYALEFNKTFFEGTSDLTKEEIVKGTYSDIYFTLKDKDGKPVYVVESTDDKYDYIIVKDDKVKDSTSKLKLTLVDKDGKEVTRNEETVQNDDKLVIRIKGLDSAEYKIDESVETGKTFEYNTVTNKAVEIKTGVQFKQDWNGTNGIYEEIKYTFDDTTEKTANKTGTADGTIENKKGSTLPSTGGIGTTIFYLGGGAMVAVAGVFLITKKRMGKSEN